MGPSLQDEQDVIQRSRLLCAEAVHPEVGKFDSTADCQAT
jgi:hypothetical protein